MSGMYGCGNRDVGPCVSWARFGAVVDALIDAEARLRSARNEWTPVGHDDVDEDEECWVYLPEGEHIASTKAIYYIRRTPGVQP